MTINALGQRVGDPVPGWTRRQLPTHTELAGAYCRLERLDADRHAESLAGLGFQSRTKLSNSRHNPAVEYAPAQAEQQPGRSDQPKQAAQNRGDPSEAPGRRGWQAGQGGRADGDGLH